MNNATMSSLVNLLPLVLLFAVLYFLMIRPQKKKDKAISEMRKSLTVGDEVVTIGGICGKIVRTKDETITIQVGADKVKFEMMRWAVSSVTKEAPGKARENVDYIDEEDKPKRGVRRLRKEAPIPEAEVLHEEEILEDK